jgi:hypothetical protein
LLPFVLAACGSDNDTIATPDFDFSETGLYVDGESGSDADGDGTRAKPFGTIQLALTRAAKTSSHQNRFNIYVMSLPTGSYQPSGSVNVPTGVSLFGGFNDNWERDVANNRTRVSANSSGIVFSAVDTDAWFSGFELTTASSADPRGVGAFGITASEGSATLRIEDCTSRVRTRR